MAVLVASLLILGTTYFCGAQQTQLYNGPFPPSWSIQNPRWAVDTARSSYYYRATKTPVTWAYVNHDKPPVIIYKDSIVHDTVTKIVLVPDTSKITIYGTPTLASVLDLKGKIGTPGQAYICIGFKNGSTYGGGIYVWATGTPPVDVLGLNVIPTGSTSGYWVKQDRQLSPEVFGADHSKRKIYQDGITQAQANSYWQGYLSQMGCKVDVVNDTWDWIGLQLAMYYLHKNKGGTIEGIDTREVYWPNKDVQLPFLTTSNNTDGLNAFYKLSNFDIKETVFFKGWIFRDTVIGTSDGTNDINCTRHFIFDNVQARHQFAHVSAGTNGLQLEAAYNSVISNCTFGGFDTCFSIKFAMQTLVTNNFAFAPRYRGFFIGTSNYAKGQSGYGQANGTTLLNNHVNFIGYGSEVGFEWNGVSDGAQLQTIIEGGIKAADIPPSGNNMIGVRYSNYNTGYNHAKEWWFNGMHEEVGGSVKKLFDLNLTGGFTATIERVYNQGIIDSGFVSVSGDGPNYLYIRHIPWNTNFKMADRSNGATTWNFYNAASYTINDGRTWRDAANWLTNAKDPLLRVPAFNPQINANNVAGYPVDYNGGGTNRVIEKKPGN